MVGGKIDVWAEGVPRSKMATASIPPNPPTLPDRPPIRVTSLPLRHCVTTRHRSCHAHITDHHSPHHHQQQSTPIVIVSSSRPAIMGISSRTISMTRTLARVIMMRWLRRWDDETATADR